MQILITNYQLDHRTGTEIVVRDLERGLRARGHAVCVYTQRPGVLSDEIIAAGGNVVTALDQVPFIPDVIHGHHNGPATEAALHFPSTPLIFVCHSRHFWLDVARGVPSVREYVAVDLNCYERLVAEGVAPDSIHVITNAADIDRFVLRREESVSSPPRKAAIFSNQAAIGGNFVESVRRACASAGLTLDVLGDRAGRSIANPERMLADYDVVFAKARCAVEAMVAGCAVLAADEAGYGGPVTHADVDWILDWNVGDRCLQQIHDSVAIEDDLRRIDAEDVHKVSLRVRERCSLSGALDAYERLYGAAIEAERGAHSPPASSWQQSHDALTQYAADLEAKIGADDLLSRPPLPPSIGTEVGITATSAPRVVDPTESFSIQVEITNRSRESLASVGATPVQLSYQWLDPASGPIVGVDSARTRLTRRVASGSHRQQMLVVAPAHTGYLTLRITLVQEFVTWFTDLPTPVYDDVSIVVGERSVTWRLADIAALVDMTVVRDAAVANLGFISSPLADMLTFTTTPGFVDAALRGGCTGVIVPPALAAQVPSSIGLLVSDEPVVAFHRIHQYLASHTDFYGHDIESRVHPRARVHPTATIDERNVRIGADVVVGAGSVISGRVRIAAGAVISPGAVVGASGFQTIRVDGRPVEFVHVGGVAIGESALVFSNATVARGLFRQDTVLGTDCRIGNNAFVSHNVQIGPRSVVGHGAVVNGNVAVGADVWIGPGATVSNSLTIGDGARIDLGATVIGNVAPEDHLGGPPAINHRAVLREVARWRSRAKRK